MLDFLLIKTRITNKGVFEIYPDFKVGRSKDLMVQGGVFYAIWNQEAGLWSRDEYDAQLLIDKELRAFAENHKDKHEVYVRYTSVFSTGSWTNFKLYLTKLANSAHELDSTVTFSNTQVTKKDYVSKRLPYPLDAGDTRAFDELFTTLYDEEELTKLMWAIGSVVAGQSKKIQKFYVLFGPPGTGKSTALNLIQAMFGDYTTSFEANVLTSGTSRFANEVFKENPLIGINHEGDLTRIKDNSVLNSIVSHDTIVMNVKFQSAYTVRLYTSLFIATNKPVTITDANSGLIRRMIDIRPTGRKIQPDRYDDLVSQMDFELGAIAHKCLQVFLKLGKGCYSRYKPVDMILRTNPFFNFVDEHYYTFKHDDQITLTRAWELYKTYNEQANLETRIPRHAFRDEFKAYWREFHTVIRIDGVQVRSLYRGFDDSLFFSGDQTEKVETVEETDWLELKEQPSVLDALYADQKAQQVSEKSEAPTRKWERVTKTLKDINTSKLHYVLPMENHIVIDFDLRDEFGEKSLKLNIEAARRFPPTYAEISKGGNGLHLSYIYDGNVEELSRFYDIGIEVITSVGLTSIRRKLSRCNNLPLATISSGLPLKEKKMISTSGIGSERALRLLLQRILNREIHEHTAPSVSFIEKVLNEAYASGVVYDVTDMKPHIISFASSSTNQARECLRIALSLPYMSDRELTDSDQPESDTLVFFDMEVYPNLNIVCWKYEGEEQPVVRMFNPSPQDVEPLLRRLLVGYNCRRYDNHILYAIYMGYTPEMVYNISSRIINKDRTAFFREAYKVSYTDVYDFATTKQTLKEWELDLGLTHMEMEHSWDLPLPKDQWEAAADYCANDVLATEAVFNHLKQDFRARQILAELSGLTVNDSTLAHTAKIVFGDDKNPQKEFKIPNLAKEFPGYTFDNGVSRYKERVAGEGGYVFAKPGMYRNVLYADINSMHPTTAIWLNLFGKYTPRYSDLLEVRFALKRGDVEAAAKMFDGRLKPYLEDKDSISELAYSLKIALNIVYGMTAAKFDNPFRHIDNRDNVVAKRGALFMIDLEEEALARGTNLVHIKTDSVKIADYTEDDLEFVMEFGKMYGYTFSVEGVFEKMCLINNAVLIGKWSKDHPKHPGQWEATGARFAHPYVFKTLFDKTSPILFDDFIERRGVKKGSIYLREENDSQTFIGSVGEFVCVKNGGGDLLRVDGDKVSFVADTKGWKWLPANVVREAESKFELDLTFYRKKVDEAIDEISKYGDSTEFIS